MSGNEVSIAMYCVRLLKMMTLELFQFAASNTNHDLPWSSMLCHPPRTTTAQEQHGVDQLPLGHGGAGSHRSRRGDLSDDVDRFAAALAALGDDPYAHHLGIWRPSDFPQPHLSQGWFMRNDRRKKWGWTFHWNECTHKLSVFPWITISNGRWFVDSGPLFYDTLFNLQCQFVLWHVPIVLLGLCTKVLVGWVGSVGGTLRSHGCWWP